MSTYIVCWADENGNKIWDKVKSDKLKSFLFENKLLDLNTNELIENAFIFSEKDKHLACPILNSISSEYANLSSKQQLIYNAIKDFQSEYGYAPSVRELCSLTGYASSSTVHAYLVQLEDVNMIQRDKGKPRVIQL